MIKHVRTPNQQIADLKHQHASGCDGVQKRKHHGKVVIEPCRMCQNNIQFFAGQPLTVLSEMLTDVPAKAGTMKLMHVAVDNFVERTDQVISGGRKGRAMRDIAAAAKLFKSYEQAGGRF